MKPGAIVAIGGGEIGRPGKPVETLAIDRAAIALTSKKQPNVLFLPTASRDSSGYVQAVHEHFGNRLHCPVRTLYLYEQRPADVEIRQLIDWADLIYVGGGNTVRMLKRWRKFGVDQLLVQAHRRGKILAGISAGGMCWFQFGLTDCWRHQTPRIGTVVRGLNLIPGMFCPHMDVEPHRAALFKKALKDHPVVGLAADNCTALVFEADQFRVFSAQPAAWAYQSWWRAGQFVEERLPATGPLSAL